jgi:hypothetical protein
MDTLIPDFETGKLVGFKYPYRKCARSILGVCTRWELVEVRFRADDENSMRLLEGGDWVLKRRKHMGGR